MRKDHPGFRRLSYKFLRKTNSQLHQDEADASDQTISVMHARGRQSASDDQADRYYRRSFTRVYEANSRLRTALQSIFEAVPNAFTNPQPRGGSNIGLITRERIVEEYNRCGNKSEVARRLQISRETVHRHLRREAMSTSLH